MDNHQYEGDGTLWLETVPIFPSFIEEQGDVFQCGRCKQNFYYFMDFLSHKREHQMANDPKTAESSPNIVALTSSQINNEIWILKEQDLEVSGREEGPLHMLDDPTTQINVVEQTLTANCLNYLDNNSHSNISPLGLRVTEESVNSLSCFTCGECFQNDSDISIHNKTHISFESCKQITESAELQIQSNNISPSRKRLKPKKQEKHFQCAVCGRVFYKKSTLQKHTLSHKVWPDGLNKTMPSDNTINTNNYMCPYCQETFPSHVILRTHLKEHNHQKVFKCIQEKCAVMFADLESLVSHIDLSHDTAEYQCYMCSASFVSLDEIAEHYKAHPLEECIIKQTYQCDFCNVTFKRKDNLKHHLETANHTNKCKFCSKYFTSERSLRKHLLQHDPTKSYECTVCGMTFKLKQYLLSHQVVHKNEKCFSCNVCNKEFKRKDLLVRHTKLHQPEQRKSCTFKEQLGCMAEFSRTDKLNQHIKKHLKSLNVQNKKL